MSEIPEDLKQLYQRNQGLIRDHETEGCPHVIVELIERIADLTAENATLKIHGAALEAHGRRLEGLLTGADRQETADKIFEAARGSMNTRSVWILADELIAAKGAK